VNGIECMQPRASDSAATVDMKVQTMQRYNWKQWDATKAGIGLQTVVSHGSHIPHKHRSKKTWKVLCPKNNCTPQL